ncbi:MAG: XrtA system polysaccharide deacetylase [Burkholderiales bacterium]
MITNALTVDVEDYFQVSAFEPHIDRADWDRLECRVERNITRILALFAQHNAKATFFTLGWVAERYPTLVREIVQQGHELASHGFAHQRASGLSEADFFADISRAKSLLEDVAGVAVKGYRAPSFSINERNLWAFDALSRAGYAYSSSIYPIRHDHYGMPDAPRFAHRRATGLLEIPITTLRLRGRNFPASGGGYFRLLPYRASKWMFSQVNRLEQRPVVFYFHPWEIDPDQPRIQAAAAKAKFRHYLNLNRMEGRLAQLLQDFRWGRMDAIFLGEPHHGPVPFASAALQAA